MKNDYIARYSLNSGDYENLSLYEQRRYLIFAFFATIAVFVTLVRLFYINFLSGFDYDPIVKFINTIPFALCIYGTLVMNAKNYKKILMGSYLIMPIVISVAHYYTADEGLEYFILLYIIFTFFLFDKPIEVLIAFIYNSIHFLSISGRDFFYLSQKMNVLPYDSTLVIFNIVSGTVLMFLSFYIVKMQLWKYEKVLTDRTKEMEDLNELKDKVFSTIAHDLRSPMAANLTLLKGLENYDGATLKDYKSYIPAIRSSIEDTTELVFDLLTWAKNELQKNEPLLEKIYLKELVAETIKELQKKASEKNILLSGDLDENKFVIADKGALKIVLRNLVSNAIKFTASGGFVHVKSEINNGFLDIKIVDNGIGISADKLKLLFKDNFYTSRGTNNESGTGLGLIICDSLVKKSKGSIKIESEVNHGTMVIVSLPSLN